MFSTLNRLFALLICSACLFYLCATPSVKTNDAGDFEILLGAGSYDIRPPYHEKAEKFELNDETERQFTVTTNIEKMSALTGKVVAGNPPMPVAGAKLSAVPRMLAGGEWEATANAEGLFKVDRIAETTVVQVKSVDGSLGIIQEIAANDNDVIFQLLPTTSLKGRLIDGATGAILAKADMRCLIKVDSLQKGIYGERFDHNIHHSGAGGKVTPSGTLSGAHPGLLPGAPLCIPLAVTHA